MVRVRILGATTGRGSTEMSKTKEAKPTTKPEWVQYVARERTKIDGPGVRLQRAKVRGREIDSLYINATACDLLLRQGSNRVDILFRPDKDAIEIALRPNFSGYAKISMGRGRVAYVSTQGLLNSLGKSWILPGGSVSLQAKWKNGMLIFKIPVTKKEKKC